VVKRGVDIVLSALLLCLSLPILALSALIIRISSPGPVLFRQERMGRRFQPFQILKLRTMAHAHAGMAYTLGPDPRITFFGRFLRRTKFDELPQLWNVLRGEMSIVGPRPVLPELTSEFRVHYSLLLRARPGLTDPASLKYSQEARLLATAGDPMHFFKTVVTPDKIELSLEYMESANLWTDTVTLLMTGLICCAPSMSRVYGRLPRPEGRVLRQPASEAPGFWRTPRALDQSLFSHALAELEASEELEAPSLFAPWNQRHIPEIASQSPTRSIRGGASRL
jgi:lipopolysaccharide/colanic/teichoic acid biosynthesis glycosyltransferase